MVEALLSRIRDMINDDIGHFIRSNELIEAKWKHDQQQISIHDFMAQFRIVQPFAQHLNESEDHNWHRSRYSEGVIPVDLRKYFGEMLPIFKAHLRSHIEHFQSVVSQQLLRLFHPIFGHILLDRFPGRFFENRNEMRGSHLHMITHILDGQVIISIMQMNETNDP